MTLIPLFLFYFNGRKLHPTRTQSKANTPVTPSEPEGSKGKGKRNSEGLITAIKWMPIATQRDRKPTNSASIQGKPTLTTCTGKITIIDPVGNSKCKMPKSADKNFLQGTVKEDQEGLSRTRRPGGGHLGHSGGCQETEENHTHCAIHFPIQQEPQTRGLERYGSSSSAPPAPQRFIVMEHGQQEVQPRIPLGRAWSKLPGEFSQRDGLQRPYGNHQRLESHQEVQTPAGEGKQDKGESIHYPSYRRTADPDSAYSDSFRITRSRPNQLSSGSHHSETNISVAKSHHSSQSQEVSRRRQGYKGKKKITFSQRKRESDPIIQKLFDLVKEVHKNQK
ncbi:hypothetical protein O181_079653 [Austropuccinia psidii MF-1]|uniref:Uncharacterized protein n=1 Tax=Austropuccinia psidii MF-1 TaxID=1389203 RepID=A0A9Q3FLE9_9BASI|nr:hypothetical protein [Austropuccinia psidii MF-1]